VSDVAIRKSTKSTAKKNWPEKFLARLRTTGIVGVSAQAAGVSREWTYKWRANHPDFAAAWDQAVDDAVDALEAEARARAIEGESDLLLMFLLKANRPSKYREKVQTEHTGAVTVRVIYDDASDPTGSGADPGPAPPAPPSTATDPG